MNFKYPNNLSNGKVAKKKSLGQNFLKDESILNKIISAGELSKKDNVLEIGPGEGALTKRLLERVARVVAIEKDERIKDENSILQQICSKEDLSSKIKIYFDDILKVDLVNILKENNFTGGKNKYKVIANIPYYITGKIIRLLFEQEQKPKLIILLVQKEVAERICADNGRQSILSLSVQYYAQAEIVDYVPKESFEPMPKVDSAILKIIPFQNGGIRVDHLEFDKDKVKKEKKESVLSEKILNTESHKQGKQSNQEKEFFRLIKIGFSSPRKVLINNLKNGLQLDKKDLEKIFNNLNLPLDIRAEKLTIKNWISLSEIIFK